jgi:hypothetical protein
MSALEALVLAGNGLNAFSVLLYRGLVDVISIIYNPTNPHRAPPKAEVTREYFLSPYREFESS